MVPIRKTSMVSPSLAEAMAWRKLPTPLSFKFVTLMVAARALSKPTAARAPQKTRVIMNTFPFGCDPSRGRVPFSLSVQVVNLPPPPGRATSRRASFPIASTIGLLHVMNLDETDEMFEIRISLTA
jgi:hypothetical protein